jgi:hypothetical protein
MNCRRPLRFQLSPLFRFSDRDRHPDHDESRHHDDGRSRGHDHSRGDGGGGDDVTRDVAHHPRPLSSQDLKAAVTASARKAIRTCFIFYEYGCCEALSRVPTKFCTPRVYQW